MGPHRGSQDDPAMGDKKISGQKRTITRAKLKWKKLFLGEEIKQKETQMGPHRRSQVGPTTGDKIIIPLGVSAKPYG